MGSSPRRITKIKRGAKAETVMNCELALELLLILYTAGILYIPKSHVHLTDELSNGLC